MNRFTRLIVLGLALLPVGLMQAQDEPLSVVATTSIIADVARNVGGDRVIVESLVPPDADVHAFTPTPADVARVADADVVLVNGAGLEAFLGDLVTNAAIEAPIVVSTGIEILAFGGHEHGHEGEEEAHGHEHGEEIADLSPWQGTFVSGWSFGAAAMQPAFDAVLASTPELTQANIDQYWQDGNATSFDTIQVNGQDVTFTGTDMSVTCTYAFIGNESVPQIVGETWSIFETTSPGCESYRTLLMNPIHAAEEGAIPHFHFRYGAAEHDAVIADMAPWFPSLYPEGTTVDGVMGAWIAGARSVGLYVASVYNIEVALTEAETAAMQASMEEAEHSHEGEEAHVGILGDEGVCEDAHAHEEEHAEGEAHSEEEHEHEHGSCDPHVWTDPNNVKVWATNIAEAFAAADPAHADTYRANAAAYQTTLDALDAEVTALLATIPEANRVLVTNHEFFGYFAYHYGFEVAGVVIEGGTTLNAPSPQELAELIEVVEAEGVPAIFAEVSAQPELAQAVADATGINVITTIYSDSLSSGADSPASTYVDYLRYNAGVIAAALGGGL
jgi:ABC-type Zn uptake system ZnuABC Zn-binding protein ZnuA